MKNDKNKEELVAKKSKIDIPLGSYLLFLIYLFPMSFIFSYFKNYKAILLFTLFLATVNQVFSLLDPQVLRWLIDTYVTNYQEYTQQEFVRGIFLGAVALISVAMISRIAKTFEDYFVSIMTQKIGMQLYQHAIRHIFALPYRSFEEQQS